MRKVRSLTYEVLCCAIRLSTLCVVRRAAAANFEIGPEIIEKSKRIKNSDHLRKLIKKNDFTMRLTCKTRKMGKLMKKL